MTDVYRSKWINVVDLNHGFCGILFREDIRKVYKKWNLEEVNMLRFSYI
jgi:hypothetical protein